MAFPEQSRIQSLHASRAEYIQDSRSDDSEHRQLLKEAFVLKKDGDEWLVSLNDGTEDFIRISEEMGRVIAVGLEADRRVIERKGVWDAEGGELAQSDNLGIDNEDEYRRIARNRNLLGKIYGGLNCHDVIRYVLGLPIDLDGEDAEYEKLSGFEFKSHKKGELQAYVHSTDPRNFPLIGRIVRAGSKLGEAFRSLHSFIVLGVDSRGRVLCFEKVGHEEGGVRLSTLETIYSAYPQEEYSFLGLADAKRQFDAPEKE